MAAARGVDIRSSDVVLRCAALRMLTLQTHADSKEAVHIGKEGRRSMNRDEASYTLSHTYDRFLAASHHYRGKNRKKN